MRTADLADDADVAVPVKPSREPLEYDKSASRVSRRQMSLLLLFVAVDSILFAGFVCLPAAQPHLKDWWAGYQQKRDEAKRLADVRAKLEACMAFAAPADRVLYAEEPAAALGLLKADAQAWMLPATPPGITAGGGTYDSPRARAAARAAGYQAPALLRRGDELRAWFDAALTRQQQPAFGSGQAPVFVHEMRTPGGARRLVVVFFGARQGLRDREGGTVGGVTSWDLQTRRTFTAYVFDPDRPPSLAAETRLVVEEPAGARAVLSVRITDDTRPEATMKEATLTGQRHWRVFAGQHDPKDATRMTIGYEVNGKRGVIVGRLNDGERLMMTPDVGRLGRWVNSQEYAWEWGEAGAATTTTTRPDSGE